MLNHTTFFAEEADMHFWSQNTLCTGYSENESTRTSTAVQMEHSVGGTVSRINQTDTNMWRNFDPKNFDAVTKTYLKLAYTQVQSFDKQITVAETQWFLFATRKCP